MKSGRIDDLIRKYAEGDEVLSEQEVIAHQEIDERELERRKRHHVHRLWIAMLWGMCLCLGLICFVVLWHLLLPEWMRWLPNEEVRLLATGAGTAVLGYLSRSVQKFI